MFKLYSGRVPRSSDFFDTNEACTATRTKNRQNTSSISDIYYSAWFTIQLYSNKTAGYGILVQSSQSFDEYGGFLQNLNNTSCVLEDPNDFYNEQFFDADVWYPHA